ncbi:hypothetical protein Bbelb_180900 [Branchiostoma belcheri]|nr:hypothetical protein Bbelb_180900 [Branchiostoma belcheri]
MYEQAVPVRTRIAGQVSGPPSHHAPLCQRGTDGGVRLGINADATPYRWHEGIETSSDTYEKPEVVKLQELSPQGPQTQRARLEFTEDATSNTSFHVGNTVDRNYPDRQYRSLCGFNRTSRSCQAAAFAVVVTLVSVGLAVMVFTNGEGISQLSNTVDTLKRNLAGQKNLTAALKQRLDQKMSVPRPEEFVKHFGTPVSCPEEYTKWRGLCHKAFNVTKNFWQAELACHEDGGTLAMPRDNDTNAFLISLYRAVSKNNFFWIGLHDQDEEGKFKWVDGTALGEYNWWATGQPNNYAKREDCVAYSASKMNRTYMPFNIRQQPEKWYDAPCYSRILFLCQVVPEKTHGRH